jgi:hypothetical protein
LTPAQNIVNSITFVIPSVAGPRPVIPGVNITAIVNVVNIQPRKLPKIVLEIKNIFGKRCIKTKEYKECKKALNENKKCNGSAGVKAKDLKYCVEEQKKCNKLNKNAKLCRHAIYQIVRPSRPIGCVRPVRPTKPIKLSPISVTIIAEINKRIQPLRDQVTEITVKIQGLIKERPTATPDRVK